MARKVLIGLDLQWNNLEKLRLENVASTLIDGKTTGRFASNYLTKEAAIAYFSYDNTLKYKDKSGVKTIATIKDIDNNTNNFDILFGSFSVPIAVIADGTSFFPSAPSGSKLKFTENKGFCYEQILTSQSGAPTYNYYNVTANTKLSGTDTTMKDIHKRGVCISIDGQIYKYYGDEFQCPTSNWKKVHQGIALSAFSVVQTNAANGATAYGWGNHASQGYLTSSGVTAATKCKITYNSNGLVTAGADLTANDIPNLDASKITTGQFASNRVNGSGNWDTAYNWVSANGSKVLKGVVVGFNEDVTLPNTKTPYNNLKDVVFEGFAIVSEESVAIYKNKTLSFGQDYYMVGDWGTNFEEPCNKTNLEIEGNLLSTNGAIWQYKGSKWVKVYDGKTATDALDSRLSDIETMLNVDEESTQKVIDTWDEVKNFLAGYENDTTLATKLLRLETGKLDKDAFSIGTKDDENGVLTINLGTKEGDVSKFQKQHGHINGRSFEFWSPTKQSDIYIGTVHGPTSPGNYGEFPMSLGSGAPTWKTPVISILGNDSKVKWAADNKSFEISLIELGALFCSITLYETTSSNVAIATWNEIIADVSIIEDMSSSDQSSITAKVTFSEAMTHNKIRIFITPLYGRIRTTGGGGGTPVTPL